MKRRWPTISLALAVAALILTFQNLAHAQGCTPLSNVLNKIVSDSTFLEMRVLQGKKLALAVSAFNEDEEQDIPWDSAYLALRNDGWGLLMVGFDGHVCFAQRLNPDQTARFIKALYGVSI